MSHPVAARGAIRLPCVRERTYKDKSKCLTCTVELSCHALALDSAAALIKENKLGFPYSQNHGDNSRLGSLNIKETPRD